VVANCDHLFRRNQISDTHKQRLVASSGEIARRILLLRGHKALIDADLAALYGVSTKRLNQQVKPGKRRRIGFVQDE
jgi:hypothetical protein